MDMGRVEMGSALAMTQQEAHPQGKQHKGCSSPEMSAENRQRSAGGLWSYRKDRIKWALPIRI